MTNLRVDAVITSVCSTLAVMIVLRLSKVKPRTVCSRVLSMRCDLHLNPKKEVKQWPKPYKRPLFYILLGFGYRLRLC